MAHTQTTCVLFVLPLQTLIVTIVAHDGEDATMDDAEPDSEKEYPCLIRVTDGKKAKFSTHVSPFFHYG